MCSFYNTEKYTLPFFQIDDLVDNVLKYVPLNSVQGKKKDI